MLSSPATFSAASYEFQPVAPIRKVTEVAAAEEVVEPLEEQPDATRASAAVNAIRYVGLRTGNMGQLLTLAVRELLADERQDVLPYSMASSKVS